MFSLPIEKPESGGEREPKEVTFHQNVTKSARNYFIPCVAVLIVRSPQFRGSAFRLLSSGNFALSKSRSVAQRRTLRRAAVMFGHVSRNCSYIRRISEYRPLR